MPPWREKFLRYCINNAKFVQLIFGKIDNFFPQEARF